MEVKFTNTTSSNLGNIAVIDGQIIALNDSEGLYYDLNGKRYNAMRPGTSTQGGRVKLTDVYTTSQGTADSSVAASSYALATAYNTLDANLITSRFRNLYIYVGSCTIETLGEKLKENWSSIPAQSGSIIIGTDTTGYIGQYIKMPTYDGYETGSIFFTDGATSSNSYLWRYHTKSGNYSLKEVTYDADINTINTNISDIKALKSIEYQTVDGAFVYYQAGTISIKINSFGHPRPAVDYILTTSIPKNTYVQIGTPVSVGNLSGKSLIIPAILSQPSGGGYGIGYLVANGNGLYIFSSIGYTYTSGATYGITVSCGSAVY